MRKTIVLLLGLMLSASVGGVPARAAINQWTNIEFQSAAFCTHACPYWLDNANIDLDGNGKEDVFFQECANPDGTADMLADVPGVPYGDLGTYDDIVVGPAPANTKLLEVELFPTVDWDGFICQWKTGNVAGQELAALANIIGENCDNFVGPNNPVLVGCIERGNIEAAVGARYIIRAYNFNDVPTMVGRYRFRST